MINKKCNNNYDCAQVDGKVTAMATSIADEHTGEKETLGYGFYSNVLKKPFEKLDDLKKAEEVYFAEQKAKEAKAAAKKTDAMKVEEAFKALNAARKTYKEKLSQLTKEYSDELTRLKEAFEFGKKDIHTKLAEAETGYSNALKVFTNKYPEGFHLTLKDGDFETTISSQPTEDTTKTGIDFAKLSDIFDLMFNF